MALRNFAALCLLLTALAVAPAAPALVNAGLLDYEESITACSGYFYDAPNQHLVEVGFIVADTELFDWEIWIDSQATGQYGIPHSSGNDDFYHAAGIQVGLEERVCIRVTNDNGPMRTIDAPVVVWAAP